MNLMLKKKKGNGEMPSLFSDWLTPASLFGSMFNELENRLPGRIGVTIPSANIKETEKDYQIELAAPGLSRQDFQVELDNNVLTVSTEKEEEKEEEREDYARKEYSFSSFSRSFQLPENSLGDKIDAKYVDGVLKVRVPKKEVTTQKPKKQISVS